MRCAGRSFWSATAWAARSLADLRVAAAADRAGDLSVRVFSAEWHVGARILRQVSASRRCAARIRGVTYDAQGLRSSIDVASAMEVFYHQSEPSVAEAAARRLTPQPEGARRSRLHLSRGSLRQRAAGLYRGAAKIAACICRCSADAGIDALSRHLRARKRSRAAIVAPGCARPHCFCRRPRATPERSDERHTFFAGAPKDMRRFDMA